MSIDAEPRAVLAFVGDPQNLPRWAVGFAKSVRPEAGRWVVATGQGEMGLTVEANGPRTGCHRGGVLESGAERWRRRVLRPVFVVVAARLGN